MGIVTTLPRGRELTRDDLEQLPDDGHRYELIDGTLIVTPAPSRWHQRAVGRLFVALEGACPPDQEVLIAPFDVALDERSVLQPDLVVARRSDFTARDLPVAPLLAVEVLSPSTRRIDLTLKRSRYEAAGCPSYWVVDPDVPSLTVCGLENDRYVERAHVIGEERHVAAAPFEVSIVPARLVG